MTIAYRAMPTETARALQAGAPDVYGQVSERHISDGDGIPCRHCLEDVGKGEPYLILAYRPFPAPQPYAETGPIFLHADTCPAYGAPETLPASMLSRPLVLIKAYDHADRIVYGKGQLVAPEALEATARALLADPGVAYTHVRSAYNNCYSLRIERA